MAAAKHKSAVVVLSDNSRVDLDWILPLIDELKENGLRVQVFDFTPVDRDDRDSYGMRALRHILGRWPQRYADLEPIPRMVARWLDRLRASSRVAVARIGALYFSPRSPLQSVLPLAAWRAKARSKALGDMFADCTALFVGLRAEEWTDETAEAELIAAARSHGVTVIGFPPVVDHEIPHRRLMSCDIALANTPQQASDWANISGARVAAVTPPAFTRRWLRRIDNIQATLIGRENMSKDDKRALVILKNDNSIVWTGLDFHETALDMLEALLAEGLHLVIKPHPRQSEYALTRLLAAIDPARYSLVQGPLSYWAQRTDYVVSLFSGGILDCLVVGRVPVLYWPMTERYLQKVASGEVTDIYIKRNGNGKPRTKYHEFCFEVTEPGFKMPDFRDKASRLAAFANFYPAADDCSAIRELLA